MRRVVTGGFAAGLVVVLLSGCVAAVGTTASAPSGSSPAATATSPSAPAAAPAPAPPASAPADPAASETPGTDAGDLPQGLEEAVRRDLGITPEQYLAEAAAAGHASDIAPALATGGVDPKNIWLDGTTINVHATTPAARSLVESLGATPTVQTPPAAPHRSRTATAYDNLDNGTGWYLPLDENAIAICSTGFNGFASNGTPTVATAGHCLLGNAPVPSDPVTANRYVQSGPGQLGTNGGLLGTLASSSFRFGGGDDSGLIPVAAASGLTPRGQVSTWNGGTIPVRGMTNATPGAPICKSGRTTGWTCGTVYEVNYEVGVEKPDKSVVSVNSVITSMCMWHGDSGGAAMIGNYAVGINSAGSWSSAACNDPDGYSTVYPLGGDPNSVTMTQPGWQLQVAIDTPVISSTVGGATPTVSGTVPNAATGTSVSLYVDGSSTAAGTAPVAANGAWSFAPGGLSTGVHTVTAVATYGTYNRSATSAVAYLPVGVQASRLSGDDRVLTSIAVSQAAYPQGADVVYVAYGWNFPDALVSSAAAVHGTGPVLLSPQAGVPQALLDEIARLHPERIVIVGGTASLAPAVEDALKTVGPSVERISGVDRFDTARQIVSDAFESGPVAELYIATGVGFPDSLSASAAAAAKGVPVLTVQGNANALDAATVSTIQSLHPQRITVVGGTASVTAGVYAQLGGLAPAVRRIGGPDRFTTSQLVAQDAFPSAAGVYLASGLTFPDALTGSVAAAVAARPLLLTPATCAAGTVTASMYGWHASAITLVGGPNTLTADVAALKLC